MKYKTTRQADEDIINIYVHGATAYGVGQAEAYLAELTASFSLLADNPYLARERPEFDPPVRIHRQDLVLVRALVRKGAGEARRGLDPALNEAGM
ncbi:MULTISPECIES: type II toxin-antitoxin system RelE/ParE family toxin [Paracoccus]|uniref:type II toxin-antitoxin system RelE/ParE family toxin n=1 Tax=Paracoccus TaxID=265 RepID=UPI001FB66B7A|nr:MULTISPECIES: type II toxin-antitoxin system RelE/ParE family toxin [Paracoccus]MCJ1901241.1 type II toxin-antitoxin system RelE/ParE family toxin [Paracoccus versutus]MDF3905877.1 type II toxin-antitoxin system RelE/ParE family toxin [Paracoccus sp. AS002]